MRFVVVFGVVSLLGDFLYEGGRSVVGPTPADPPLVSDAVTPSFSALAMGMGAVAALGSRRLYDRVG